MSSVVFSVLLVSALAQTPLPTSVPTSAPTRFTTSFPTAERGEWTAIESGSTAIDMSSSGVPTSAPTRVPSVNTATAGPTYVPTANGDWTAIESGSGSTVTTGPSTAMPKYAPTRVPSYAYSGTSSPTPQDSTVPPSTGGDWTAVEAGSVTVVTTKSVDATVTSKPTATETENETEETVSPTLSPTSSPVEDGQKSTSAPSSAGSNVATSATEIETSTAAKRVETTPVSDSASNEDPASESKDEPLVSVETAEIIAVIVGSCVLVMIICFGCHGWVGDQMLADEPKSLGTMFDKTHGKPAEVVAVSKSGVSPNGYPTAKGPNSYPPTPRTSYAGDHLV